MCSREMAGNKRGNRGFDNRWSHPTRNGAGFLSHSLFIRLISAGTLKGWCAVRTLQEAVQDFYRSSLFTRLIGAHPTNVLS